jgi:hypothetical protein
MGILKAFAGPKRVDRRDAERLMGVCIVLLLGCLTGVAQHSRVPQTEVPGRLFVGAGLNTKRPVPLVMHFHGAPWLVEFHVAKTLPHAALITVQLGSGSSAYGRSFEQVSLFQSLLDEAAKALELKRGWSTITLTGFSAGYGGIRQILRAPNYFQLVNNVLLLDGMHASYEPEGIPGVIRTLDVEPYVRFANEAVKGRKKFVFTHSQIVPGTYASTTECGDYVLAQLKLTRRPSLKEGPIGMQQLTTVDERGLHFRGYAGTTAADHVDHLQAMSEWLGLLKIK